MLRIEMNDHDESGAGVLGKRGKEGLEGVDAAGGRTDGDDQPACRLQVAHPAEIGPCCRYPPRCSAPQPRSLNGGAQMAPASQLGAFFRISAER
jgi:hypothetical protein